MVFQVIILLDKILQLPVMDRNKSWKKKQLLIWHLSAWRSCIVIVQNATTFHSKGTQGSFPKSSKQPRREPRHKAREKGWLEQMFQVWGIERRAASDDCSSWDGERWRSWRHEGPCRWSRCRTWAGTCQGGAEQGSVCCENWAELNSFLELLQQM